MEFRTSLLHFFYKTSNLKCIEKRRKDDLSADYGRQYNSWVVLTKHLTLNNKLLYYISSEIFHYNSEYGSR